MKRILLIAILSMTITFCNAQKKDSITVLDSIPLLSIRQVNEVFAEMKKSMTIDQLPLYQYFISLFQKEIDKSILELKKKKQK